MPQGQARLSGHGRRDKPVRGVKPRFLHQALVSEFKNCETGDSVGCIGTVRVLFMG